MGGTCGAAVWAAAEVALAMVDAAGGDEGEAPSLAERCRERRVIELGAGMGTLGLALALHGASHVTLTDVAEDERWPGLSTRLQTNLQRNAQASGVEAI